MLSHAENKAPLIGGRPLASSDKFRLMPALEPQRVNFSKSVELFAAPQSQKLREVQRIARMALPSRAIRTLSFTLRLVCRENAHGPTLTKSLAARRRLAGCQEIGTPPHFVKKTNEGFFRYTGRAAPATHTPSYLVPAWKSVSRRIAAERSACFTTTRSLYKPDPEYVEKDCESAPW